MAEAFYILIGFLIMAAIIVMAVLNRPGDPGD